jgi:hypothetical protein
MMLHLSKAHALEPRRLPLLKLRANHSPNPGLRKSLIFGGTSAWKSKKSKKSKRSNRLTFVLLGRVLSVYLLVPLSNRFAEKIPLRWQHVAVWGGLRGALALALALSLNTAFPYREQILNLTFGVVIFSIVVQGLTIKPLVRILKLANGDDATPACT